jgi:hypothetical protein
MTQLARIIGHPTLTYISNIARQTQTTHPDDQRAPALTSHHSPQALTDA